MTPPAEGGQDPLTASLAQVTEQQRHLRAHLDAGTLRIDAGTAERAAEICEQHIERVTARQHELDRLPTHELALGDCLTGQRLSTQIHDRLHGSDITPGAAGALRALRQALVELAATYRHVAAVYQHTDEAQAERIQRDDP